MSDDIFRGDGGEGVNEFGNGSSVGRRSTVTERLDAIFDLLCDSRRRYLCYYLVAVEGDVVELSTAVDAVYRYEAAGGETDDRPSREEVRIALHHEHLPRLSEAAVLDYDPRQGTIRLTEDDALEEWVEHARSAELE